MYENYFGLTERPFSIAPDPQYLYMSKRHKEAMAHLSYGLTQGGCFIVLTGEVGTGKTTLCRNLLGELPNNVDVALILNANINEVELLQSICDELKINYAQDSSQKQLLDAINQHLLTTFADNRHTVLIIDEAQLLSRDVLEQIRLLTNLETTKSKLLQIILIGQPELNEVLARNDLRQLAQRVTARYHLGALHRSEIEDYVNFRLSVAGCKQPLFSRQALNKLHTLTDGIPRKINVLADHALLAAYAETARVVDAKMVKTAAADVFIQTAPENKAEWLPRFNKAWWAVAAAFVVLNVLLWWIFSDSVPQPSASGAKSTTEESIPEPDPSSPSSQPQIANGGPVQQADAPTDTSSVGRVVVVDEVLDTSATIPAKYAAEFETSPSAQQEQVSGDVELASLPEDESTSLAPTTPFARLLATSADRTSRSAAFQYLAELWGQALPVPLLNPACEELKSKGLYCLGFDDWAQWLRYNRSAVLVLEYDQQLHRVVVNSINAETANVVVGGESIQVSLAELQGYWGGQGVLFWQPNASGTPLLQMGDAGSAVVSARQLLNRALLAANLPLLKSANSPEFNLDMAQKIFALQTRFQIISDSKIGNETWMLMNELVSPDLPQQLRQRN